MSHFPAGSRIQEPMGSKKKSDKAHAGTRNKKPMSEPHVLLHDISRYADRNMPWIDFLKTITNTVIKSAACDMVALWLEDDDERDSCHVARQTKKTFNYDIRTFDKPGDGTLVKNIYENENTDRVYESKALIPITVGDRKIGLLGLFRCKKNDFSKSDLEAYKNLVPTLGLILMNHRSQAALRERVKELVCLYEIARAVEQPDFSLEDILKQTTELLPSAWQYPEIAHARIMLGGRTYSSAGYREGKHTLAADIVVDGEKRGCIEVSYEKEMVALFEGPFLREERSLINNIATELALIIGRKEEHDHKVRLNKQLRHADRLATIGQLAAGVAHEINEPLSGILGFAQLAQKDPDISRPVRQDIEKIINATLHAREIVRKLLIFARQMPAQKTRINLNEVIKEGLYFLESRCAKEGIGITYSLEEHLPVINADPAQMTQVLVNLAVNSIQAMRDGGTLHFQTCSRDDQVVLTVRDTGGGMSEETIKKIFLPFFTTKEVNEGTGLGLPVVHGIVTSHGGSIRVDSKVGCGSLFEIRLPVN